MATARQEWAAMWPLPVTGMLGYAGSSIFAYSSGVFMLPMTREFGWSRAEFSTAFMLQTLLGFLIAPFVGRTIDRFGPRVVALAGILPVTLGFFLLSLANGSIKQWWALCLVQAFLCCLVGPAVWLTSVSGRFNASRGLALATVLSGTGAATALWPFLAERYIEHFGWRMAFPALAATWSIVLFALVFLFVGKGARGETMPVTPKGPRAPYVKRLLSRPFLTIGLSGALFCSVVFGTTLHLVPILQGNGFTLAAAAKYAVLVGIFAIIGRMIVGFLLDNLPTRPLGLFILLLPLPMSALFILGGSSPVAIMLAVAILGLSTGAETDIIIYILARQFEQQILGSIFAIIMLVLAVGAALGPLLAGALFDASGSYHLYMMVIAIPIVISAILLWSLGPIARPAPGQAH